MRQSKNVVLTCIHKDEHLLEHGTRRHRCGSDVDTSTEKSPPPSLGQNETVNIRLIPPLLQLHMPENCFHALVKKVLILI